MDFGSRCPSTVSYTHLDVYKRQEFLQAVTEVLDSLRPVIDANEELYRKNGEESSSVTINRGFCTG